MKTLWDFCGNVKINFWLLLAVSLNLAIGSYYFKAFPELLNPLNFSLLQDWYFLYGQSYPERIWWFGPLLVLLSLLGLNTFFCALRRLLQLWPKRKQLGTRFFFIKIAPTLIHFSFLMILSGHLISLVIGYHQVVPITPGVKGKVPNGFTWEILEQGCERYSFPDSLKGSIRQCSVSLRLQDSRGCIIEKTAVLRPLRWNGYSFHLDLTGKQRGHHTPSDPKMNLIIKNDPGLKFIISGFLVMCALMGWYFPQRKKL